MTDREDEELIWVDKDKGVKYAMSYSQRMQKRQFVISNAILIILILIFIGLIYLGYRLYVLDQMDVLSKIGGA